jgi:DNA primase
LEKLGWSIEASNGELRFCCPLCESKTGKPDHKHHLYVNLDKGVFNCFRCGTSGSLDYLARMLGVSGFDLESDEETVATVEKLRENFEALRPIKLRPMVFSELQLPDGYVPINEEHLAWDYLVGRGVKPEDIKDYNLGVSPCDLYSRIYFPGYGADGKIVFYVSRCYLYEREPKYVNPKLPDVRRSFVWNLQRIRQEDHGSLILCEGPISAMVAGRNAVAALGKEVSVLQLNNLCRVPVETVYVALDPDAFDKALKVWRAVAARGKDSRLVVFPEGKDPADVGREGVEALVAEALPYSFRDWVSLKMRSPYD